MKKLLESKHLEDSNTKEARSNKTSMLISNKPKKSSISEKLNQMQIDYPVNPSTFYIDRENENLIHNYGPEIYEYSKELESLPVPSEFLKRHKIDPQTRTKMVDWMIEVLYAYNSDSPTIFLAIHIMDLYIWKSRIVLTNNDIHLIGIVSIYLASKMEDIVPLRMTHIKVKIGHNKFSEKEIKKQERIMLETINYEIITSSTYDFIKTFIFDFCHNNKEYIQNLNMNKILDMFDSTAIYLSKLVAHSEDFISFR